MNGERISILFLCTGNSARSIMAEAIANRRFGDRIDARSAGSTPKGRPHPLALETLRREGLHTDDLRSEHWDRYRDRPFDLVVTLCDAAAAETCPTFPGAPVTAHWGFPDPPAAPDPKAAFAEVYRGLCDVIERFARSGETDLFRRAARPYDVRPESPLNYATHRNTAMARPTTEPTTALEKQDRCANLPHRPRVLLGKMGLDGHDRGVKLIARALRDSGVHVIYSGLWQTPRSLAISARDEDADCLACSMMSNSHLVLVPRLIDECRNVGRSDMVLHVGGIIPQEDVAALTDAGVHRLFHTGTTFEEIVEAVRDATKPAEPLTSEHPTARLARNISLAQEGKAPPDAARRRPTRVIGLTGAPGAGKSTLVAAMATESVRRGERLAVVAFDPMSPITNGALLGDRLRVDFNRVDENVFYRSLAISGEDYAALPEIVELIGGAGFDRLIIETVGAGQNEVRIRGYVDNTAVVVVPGMGDAVQMEKAGILEIADEFVINKADHAGENQLKRELLDIAAGRAVFETVATEGRGVVELLDALFGA